MPAPYRDALSPRKTPRQARSAATVSAIFEATIQVLLSDGAAGLTTTRVAERAGDAQTQAMADTILGEERGAAEKIHRAFDSALDASLHDLPPSHPKVGAR